MSDAQKFVPAGATLSVTVSQEELAKAVPSLVSILPKTEIFEDSGYMFMEAFPATANSVAYVSILASDSARSLQYNVEVRDVTLPGVVYLPGKKFSDVIKLATGDIRIEVIGTRVQIYSSGTGTMWTLTTIPFKQRPTAIKGLEGVEAVTVPAKPFCVALAMCSPAVSRVKARPSLMQVEVRDSEIVASDGAAVHTAKFEGGVELTEFTIPVESIADVVRFAKVEEDILIRVGEGRTSLQSSTATMTFLHLTVDFPDLTKSLLSTAVTNRNLVTLEPKQMLSAIDRVMVTSDKVLKTAHLDFIPGKLTQDGTPSWTLQISSEDEAGNATSELVPVNLKGNDKVPPLKIDLSKLRSAVNAVRSPLLYIRYGDDSKTKKHNIIIDDGGERFKAVLSQVR